MKRRSKNASKDVSVEAAAAISVIGAKIFGIGELIKFRGGEPSLNEESVNYGIGEILTDLAEELEEIKRQLDARSIE